MTSSGVTVKWDTFHFNDALTLDNVLGFNYTFLINPTVICPYTPGGFNPLN